MGLWICASALLGVYVFGILWDLDFGSDCLISGLLVTVFCIVWVVLGCMTYGAFRCVCGVNYEGVFVVLDVCGITGFGLLC